MEKILGYDYADGKYIINDLLDVLPLLGIHQAK